MRTLAFLALVLSSACGTQQDYQLASDDKNIELKKKQLPTFQIKLIESGLRTALARKIGQPIKNTKEYKFKKKIRGITVSATGKVTQTFKIPSKEQQNLKLTIDRGIYNPNNSELSLEFRIQVPAEAKIEGSAKNFPKLSMTASALIYVKGTGVIKLDKSSRELFNLKADLIEVKDFRWSKSNLLSKLKADKDCENFINTQLKNRRKQLLDAMDRSIKRSFGPAKIRQARKLISVFISGIR